MLRIAFALLMVANVGYYLWNHGHLAGVGLAPMAQTEPQRLEQQIRPEALTIVSNQTSNSPAPEGQPAPVAPPPPVPTPSTPVQAEPVTPAPAPAPTLATAPPVAPVVKEPTTCAQTSGLDERQADGLRRALASRSKELWELNSVHQGGRWMVYMGKFPDADFLDRKRSELRAMNVDFDRAGSNLEPGLSLGRFSSEEAASRHLSTLSGKGVRTARVVQERPEVTTYTLRLPKATASFKAEIEASKYMDGKSLRSCPR